MIVLHNKNSGNNQIIAQKIASRLGCHTEAAEDNPDLSPHSIVIIVCPNAGDEELPEPLESFLVGQTLKNIKYAICEIGNYFGFEKDLFGSKKVAIGILQKLEWDLIAHISIDTFPEIEHDHLDNWIEEVNEILSD